MAPDGSTNEEVLEMKLIASLTVLLLALFVTMTANAQCVQYGDLSTVSVRSFASAGPNLYAGGWGNVYLSTDTGGTWVGLKSGLPGQYVEAIAADDAHLLAGTFGDGVLFSTDGGATWEKGNNGLADYSLFALAIHGGYAFAGANSGIWRCPLSHLITSVGPDVTALPGQFDLSQNYPNPFNPATVIRYALPTSSYVALTVFNELGQEVTTPVRGEQEAGYHDVKFDGTGLSSGVYFYRLVAGDYVSTKKLLLLQ